MLRLLPDDGRRRLFQLAAICTVHVQERQAGLRAHTVQQWQHSIALPGPNHYKRPLFIRGTCLNEGRGKRYIMGFLESEAKGLYKHGAREAQRATKHKHQHVGTPSAMAESSAGRARQRLLGTAREAQCRHTRLKGRFKAPQLNVLHFKLLRGGQRLVVERLAGVAASVDEAGVDPQAKAPATVVGEKVAGSCEEPRVLGKGEMRLGPALARTRRRRRRWNPSFPS